MPNICWNNLTIISRNNPEELNTLINTELNPNTKIIKKGKNGIYLTLESPWIPDFNWLKKLIIKYPSCWIKNEWKEESGKAGIFIIYMNNNDLQIENLEWNDLSIEEEYYLFYL